MEYTQKAIYDFHKKHQFPLHVPLNGNRGFDKIIMKLFCKVIAVGSKLAIFYWKHSGKKNESFYRLHLMAEELCELMEGINKGDILKTADGLGDLLYVVCGTGVAYDLPCREIVEAICISNATKSPRDPDKNVRLRDKGSEFEPPDIGGALVDGWIRLNEEDMLEEWPNDDY